MQIRSSANDKGFSVLTTAPANCRPYRTVNIIFFLLLTGVFVYAALYSPETSRYPIPSLYNRYMPRLSPTTGLSHSFSAIVRGDLHGAAAQNPYGIRVFIFFFLEWLFRAIAFLSLKKEGFPCRKLLWADSSLTVILFVCCFGKLLLFWNYL